MSEVRCAKGLAAMGFVVALASGSVFLGVAHAQTDAPAVVTNASAPTSAPPSPAPAPLLSGAVAAIVNDDVISTYDLRQRALLLIVTSGVQPTQENLPQIQQEALRSLIDEHLQMQELRKLEKDQKFPIVADDDEVNDALVQLAKENNSNEAQLKNDFAHVGLDLQTLRDQLRVQISWNRMISGRYGTRVHIGSGQISQALQRVKQSQSEPRYQVSEIFIDASRAGGMNEAMTGAQQLINQINQGAPFGPVARQFSSDPSAASNGDIGWVSAAELAPELGAAVEQMRPGQISQPIQVADGVYIIQLKEKRTGGGVQTVHLKQAAVRLAQDAKPDEVEAARKVLAAFKDEGATCANLESKASGRTDLVAGDLGESELSDLSPDFRAAAENMEVGQFSDPIRTPVGLHLIMVCNRNQAKVKTPSRDEVENRLFADQLAMLSRRYLRDLRNTATIEQP
jgi:peptidyl-prolyl cis-trans isomerase SurA